MTGSTIRERRREAGISIRQMESLTGINRGKLSIIERGVAPTLDEHIRIERALEEEHERDTAEPVVSADTTDGAPG